MPRNERGSTVIEFALVLPLLLLIVFGTIEFGLLLYNKQVLTNASREGARAGIVQRNPRLTDPEIQQVVLDYCGVNLITFDAAKPPPAIATTANPAASFGDNLTVNVAYTYQFLIFPDIVVNLFLGTAERQVQVVAQTTMRYE